jgi:hemoglobin/transferrin/lactoferrin receptor protein
MEKAIPTLTPVLLAASTLLTAQDFLDPLVLTATRSYDTLAAVPHTVSVLGSDYLSDNTRRTLPEALQFTPGVMVQKTAHGHGSPFVRGFTGRQNLLLVDGVRFNNSLFRGGPIQYWSTVDTLSLDRLELVRSHGSVMFGSDAVGGTLNAFTRSSNFADRPEGEFFNHGSAYYEYRSNGEGSHIGRVESAIGVGGKWGLLAGISLKDFGDIEDSAVGLMRNTGYPEQDLDLRFDAALGPDTTMTFLHQQVNQDDIWRWHSTTLNPGWQHSGHVVASGRFNYRIYDQERALTYLRFAGEIPTRDSWLDRWSATISHQRGRDSEAQDRYPSLTDPARPIDRRYQIAEIETWGLDLEFESEIGPGTLVYGIDYYHDEVDSEGYSDKGAGLLFDPARRPVADDSSYDLFGAWAQYQWKPVEGTRVDFGGRYTYAEADLGRYWDKATSSDMSASRHWDETVFSLRAIRDLNTCWSIYGGASQAFRAPNLDDLSGNLTTLSGTPNSGSINVEPEEFITYELGARRVTADAYLNIAAYYTDIRDIITPVPDGAGNTITTNGQDGYVYGIELEGAWRFHPQWTVSGFVAWQDGKTKVPTIIGGPPVLEDELSRVMPLTGSLALRWTHPNDRLWIEGRILTAGTADELSAANITDVQRIPTGGTPRYTVAMLHAGWQANENLELTAGLENITDEDYRTHGSGQNNEGFNAILGAKVSW